MKSTFEKKELEAVFKITVEDADWESAVNKAYNRTKGKYKIPGFRPGKAPRRMIELHYGPDVFFNEAVDECVNDAYYEQLSAHPELDVFGQPEVNFDKPADGAKLAFTITVTLNPVVKLGEYKGIKLPKIEYNVSDEDVQARIDADLKHASRNVEVDRPAKLGDVTVIDFEGSVDGVKFDGGTAQNHELKLGSNSFIPGFEDGLVGAVKGEERDVKVKFPEEYHADNLKGKDAVFHVTVKEVREEQVPALDDAFVADHTKYATVDEYKSGLRADMEKQYKSRERNERIDAVMGAAADNAECKIADKIIAAEVDRMYHDMEQQLKSYYNIGIEDYLKYQNSTPETYKEESRERAITNIKLRNVMREIIDAEKIDVTDDEIKAKIVSDHKYAHAAEHGGSAENYAANDIILDKLFDFMLANNEFVLDKTEKSEKTKKTGKSDNGEKPAAKKTATKKPAAKKSADETAAATDGEKKPAAKKTTAAKAKKSEKTE